MDGIQIIRIHDLQFFILLDNIIRIGCVPLIWIYHIIIKIIGESIVYVGCWCVREGGSVKCRSMRKRECWEMCMSECVCGELSMGECVCGNGCFGESGCGDGSFSKSLSGCPCWGERIG